MNTVLQQEVGRYNGLLACVSDSLAAVLRALRGLVVMGPDMEALAHSLYDNKVCQQQMHMQGWRGMCMYNTHIKQHTHTQLRTQQCITTHTMA